MAETTASPVAIEEFVQGSASLPRFKSNSVYA
jgi:hypothetical protein